MARILTILAIIGALGAGAYFALRHREKPLPSVETARATRRTLVHRVLASGRVRPHVQVKVSANVSGDLLELLVKQGAKVEKGQLLAQIDRVRYAAMVRQQVAALASAKANLAVAQTSLVKTDRDLERMKGLTKAGLAPDQQLEAASSESELAAERVASAQQQVQQSEGALQDARHQLSFCTLFAPIDGEVIEIDKEVGERVRGSDFSEDVVMLIAALRAMEVRVEVSERDVVALRSGARAEIEIDAIPDKKFKGELVEVGNNAIVKNPGTEAEVATFPLKISLLDPSPDVRPGMAATVEITAQVKEHSLAVPLQALTARSASEIEAKPDGGARMAKQDGADGGAPRASLKKVVFVLAGDIVQAREVKTGIASDSDVEIVSGLKENDEVVTGPYKVLARDLRSGAKIHRKGAADAGLHEKPAIALGS